MIRFLIYVLLLLPFITAFAVSPPSKTEKVEGCVVGYSVLSSKLLNIEPYMPIYRITLHLRGEKKPAFAKGSILSVLSKGSVPPWIFGRLIKADIIFRGSKERGNYWLESISVIKGETCEF